MVRTIVVACGEMFLERRQWGKRRHWSGRGPGVDAGESSDSDEEK
jgi:hypothetical protein